MEFCSLRELQNQTGHQVYDWPVVVARDYATTRSMACEEAEIIGAAGIPAARGGQLLQLRPSRAD
jgi:hypothetical protein